MTAQGATDPCEPDAPTGLYASDTNDTSFTASWTAPAAGNPPTNYYIDVSTEEDFEVASVASDLFFSEYIEDPATRNTSKSSTEPGPAWIFRITR